jgi:uncharacterized membrane protein
MNHSTILDSNLCWYQYEYLYLLNFFLHFTHSQIALSSTEIEGGNSIMGNRNSSGEGSGQVAPSDVDVEMQQGFNQEAGTSWTSWIKLPTAVTGEEQEEDYDPCKCLNLTYTQRVWGFGICFSLGMIISIMSSFLVLNPVKFALPYTVGNVLSLLSTGFLVGPKRQCKYACASTRIVAFLIYIGCIVATLISAFALKKGFLTLLFVVTQFFAGLWYTASYVPYGREMLSRCGRAVVGQATAQVSS